MSSRREQIRLGEDEIRAFLASHKTVIVGTNGPRGLPHLMPLWYVMRGEEIWGWTYSKSQKIKNLQRDPRASLLFEDGVSYEELRGVSFECDVEIAGDFETVRGVGLELLARYGDGSAPPPQAIELIEQQAVKRSALRFIPRRTLSWDHRKLAGAY